MPKYILNFINIILFKFYNVFINIFKVYRFEKNIITEI